jgi:oligopeptide transport system substrate-binding protein
MEPEPKELKFDRRKFLVMMAAAAAAGALASCTPAQATTAPTSNVPPTATVPPAQVTTAPKSTNVPPTATVPPAPRVLNVNMPLNNGDIGVNVDPGQSTQYASYFINYLMFSGLIWLDENLKPQPDMATDWTISTDAQTYTFHIRKDLKWDDGTPINAHDWVYTIIRNLTPGLPSGQAWMMVDVAGSNDYYTGKTTDPSSIGIKALDDYTLEIKLAHPSAYFIMVCSLPAFFPIPKASLDAGGATWFKPPTVKCSGPFKLTEWITNLRATFVQNPNYQNAHPGVDKLVVNMIANAATAMAAYQAGELDIVDVTTGDFLRVQADPVLSKELTINNELGVMHLVWDFAPPFDNIKVRHAIAMSIDRETLCTTILPGAGTPAYQFLAPGLLGYDGIVGTELKYNPTQAKQLMADAGFPGGKGFPDAYFMYGGGNAAYEAMFEAIQAMIKDAIGITITLAPNNQTASGLTIGSKPYKPILWRQFWGADYPDSHDFMAILYTCAPPSDTGRYGNTEFYYCNAEFDKLVWQAAAELDPVKRAALYKQCDTILCVTNPCVIPLYYTARPRLIKPYVKGVIINGDGAPVLRKVSIEGKPA